VDVIDERSGSIDRIEGFPMLPHELFGKTWNLGPSAVAVGDGVVYVGNRGDSTICAIDAKTRKVGPCIALGPPSSGLASSPDGLAYVATTKELWVTMGAPPLGIPPPQLAITVLDAASPRALRWKTSIPVPGIPEGYGVDEQRGIFYTNLEEKDRTVAIDVRSHRIVAEWNAGCGADGPRGLAVDPVRNFVFVACTNRVIVLDAGHEGRSLGTARAGEGIDNIDYLPERNQLYVAAGKAALLIVLRVDDRGALTEIASAQTAKGARVVVAGAGGTAYVADSAGGQILSFQLAP
jgi:DNA-binding beta-propeller fold protein YncE